MARRGSVLIITTSRSGEDDPMDAPPTIAQAARVRSVCTCHADCWCIASVRLPLLLALRGDPWVCPDCMAGRHRTRDGHIRRPVA